MELNRIYTKGGDGGETSLGAGGRVSKTDPRVEAYGTVDEANAFVGLAAVEAARAGHPMAELLRSVQHDLFDAGADLCVPIGAERDGGALRVTAGQTERLERELDTANAPLAPLTSFVLPGGTALAVSLHAARTVVRRAERRVVALRQAAPDATNAEVVRYLNRLSDLLFVLGRVANGGDDVLWKPGANRT